MNTILILHGWGSSSNNWSRVKDILEKGGYRVFVPDLPGFGENTPPEKPWMIDDYANWVKVFCEKNNLPRFFLIGHSFGGGVAVKFANKFPERIEKFILVSPAIVRRKGWEKNIFLFLAKSGNLVFLIPGLSFLKPLAEKVLYAFIGTHDYHRLKVANALIMKKTFKNIIREDLRSCLPAIKIPTLIIWGKNDALTPIEEAYLIKDKIKNSELEIIKNGQHGLNLEKPEILSEKIIQFLKLL